MSHEETRNEAVRSLSNLAPEILTPDVANSDPTLFEENFSYVVLQEFYDRREKILQKRTCTFHFLWNVFPFLLEKVSNVWLNQSCYNIVETSMTIPAFIQIFCNIKNLGLIWASERDDFFS